MAVIRFCARSSVVSCSHLSSPPISRMRLPAVNVVQSRGLHARTTQHEVTEAREAREVGNGADVVVR